MKKIYLLTIISIFTLISCSQEEINTTDSFNLENGGGNQNPDNVLCADVNLIAGQNMIAGNVTVILNDSNIIVTYTTTDGWFIDATHLYVGDCLDRPANNPGNPLIGHFPYSEQHDNGTTTYTYTLDASQFTGGDICVAAHAEVSGISNETAWAEGLGYGGNSWAMYFNIDCL